MDTETTVIDIEGERNDALGDIPCADQLTLEDFTKEWVFRDIGMERVPWFHKWFHQDSGFGKNRIRGDASDTCLQKLAEREEEVISVFGTDFYNRCLRMANMSLIGAPELSVWFTTTEGEDIWMRDEALQMAKDAMNLYTSSIDLNVLMDKDEKLKSSAWETYNFFRSNKDRRWVALKKLVIEGACRGKNEQEVKGGFNVVCDEVKALLDIRGDLARFLFTFVARLYWAAVKARPTSNAEAVLVKWFNTMSIEKTLEEKSDYVARVDRCE